MTILSYVQTFTFDQLLHICRLMIKWSKLVRLSKMGQCLVHLHRFIIFFAFYFWNTIFLHEAVKIYYFLRFYFFIT